LKPGDPAIFADYPAEEGHSGLIVAFLSCVKHGAIIAKDAGGNIKPGVLVVSKIDNALSFQQQALGLRAFRQQVLAGNIANSDTPNYKAQDFDFSTALKVAVAGRGGGNLPLAKTAARHLTGSADTSAVRLMYRAPVQASADGNTVDMNVERAQFSENAVQYEAGLAFITSQIKTLMAAVQGQ
jgi:flagellar basal-body rod protein FlgB